MGKRARDKAIKKEALSAQNKTSLSSTQSLPTKELSSLVKFFEMIDTTGLKGTGRIRIFLPASQYLRMRSLLSVTYEDKKQKISISHNATSSLTADDYRITFHQVKGNVSDIPVGIASTTMKSVMGQQQTISSIASQTLIIEVDCPFDASAPKGKRFALKQAVKLIADFQRAYSIVTGEVGNLTTVRRLPNVVPFFVEMDDGTIKDYALPVHYNGYGGLFHNECTITYNTSLAFLTKEEETHLARTLDMMRQEVEAAFADAQREARVAYLAGNNTIAVSQLGAAMEIMLRDILDLLLWESVVDIAEANRVYRHSRGKKVNGRTKPFETVVAEEYASIFGGYWSKENNEVIRAWRENLAEPRNKIMHNGMRPTDEDTEKAIEAYDGLMSLLRKSITSDKRFPKTAHLNCGVPYNRNLSESIPGKLKRWRREVVRANDSHKGSMKDAEILLYVESKEKYLCILFDRSKELAALTQDPWIVAEAEVRVKRMFSKSNAKKYPRKVVPLPNARMTTTMHKSRITWLPSYQLLPMITPV